MIWDSFFDDNVDTQDYVIWNRPIENEDYSDLDNVLHSGKLMKHDKKTNSYKESWFILTHKRLYYKKKKSSSQVSKFMDCKFMRYKGYLDENEEIEEPREKLKLRFIRNLKYTDLYARSESEYRQWVDKLGIIMIRTDFHSRFEVSKILGEGGFAKVYLAKNKINKKLYAVKAFKKDNLKKQNRGRAAIKNEVEVLQQLDHPNIMKLEEVHETPNSLYLVCEYLNGGSLVEFLKIAEKFLTNDEICRILIGILSGLAYLNSKGLIHRDIKPDNIMLFREEGSPIEANCFKICDFGLAMKEGANSFIYKRCGTPGYVPPEVVRASSESSEFIFFSKKWDTFSVGVILYMLITGSSPFQAPDVKQILVKSAECKVNYNHPLLGKQSVEMHALLRGLLNPDYKKRLIAEEAIGLPVFDEYRGTLLPKIEEKKESVYTEVITFTTILEDESAYPMGSIMSLEKKSIRIMPSRGSSSYQPSLYSVVYEGNVPKFIPNDPGLGQISEKAVLSHLYSCSGSGFKKPKATSKESNEMDEKHSESDNISPLASPNINLRQIVKSNSIHTNKLYGSGVHVKKTETGVKPQLSGPKASGVEDPKQQF